MVLRLVSDAVIMLAHVFGCALRLMPPRKSKLVSSTYVAVDLETTGFDPERDAIIEIGAVKFQDERVLDTFHSLINPGRKIPFKIAELTGINQQEADAAPSLFSQLPCLDRFVGQAPVVGHNVSFDLSFLRRHNVLQTNAALDTWRLSQVLVPHAERYSLGTLAEELGIRLPATHRALDDARVTHALFVALFERAIALPAEMLKAIVKAAHQGHWSAASFFQQALHAAGRDTFSRTLGAQLAQLGQQPVAAPLFTRPLQIEPLHPVEQLLPIDVAQVSATLQQDSALAHNFDGYEYRPQQIEMLEAVADTLNRGDHLLVEAGTGTGKSLAYLLPAAHWAVRNNERVVISTNTINLQQQLINKDVPQVQSLLPFDLEAAVLKGRSHYLCLQQLERLRRRGPHSPEDARMLAMILVWLPNTLTGEDEELSIYSSSERAFWHSLSAEFEGCNPDRCPNYAKGQCFFYRARRRAEGAHLIIVNHALLLSDVAMGNRVLPPFNNLIVDEAQHLEDATANQLSFKVDRQAVARLLREIGQAERGRGARGLLGDIVVLSRACDSPQTCQRLQDRVVKLGQHVSHAEQHAQEFFDTLKLFVQDFSGPSRGSYNRRMRVESGLRSQPGWSQVEIVWDNTAVHLNALHSNLDHLAEELSGLEGKTRQTAEDLYSRIVSVERRLGMVIDQLNHIVFEPSENNVCWINASAQDDTLSLHVAPLEVGALVREHLLEKKRSVIMTSATLRVAGSFDFIRERLYAWDADELEVGSPFDYANSTLFYLVEDIPEPCMPSQPGHQAYQGALEKGLAALVKAIQGRTMALFTSYHQLRATTRAISARMAQEGISVLEQGGGSSRRQLLEDFQNTPKAVLMGTRSFWEGVDIPGEALSCLAIVRLPFAVPSDPIYAARAEQFESPFFDYFVPEAVLRFLQGFGRLIRSHSDRGVVVIFDKRLLTKSYGPAFLDSLPGPSIQQGSIANLPAAALRWIENKQEA